MRSDMAYNLNSTKVGPYPSQGTGDQVSFFGYFCVYRGTEEKDGVACRWS